MVQTIYSNTILSYYDGLENKYEEYNVWCSGFTITNICTFTPKTANENNIFNKYSIVIEQISSSSTKIVLVWPLRTYLDRYTYNNVYKMRDIPL